jgi:hypothetical protein
LSQPLVAAPGYGVPGAADAGRGGGGSRALASLRLSRTRLVFLSAVVMYVAAFWLSYIVDVVPLGEYFGFAYDEDWTWSQAMFVATLTLLPALWLPARIERPSHMFILVQYLIVYVPALFLAYHCSLPQLTPPQRTALCLTLFAGMSIMQSVQYLPLLRLPRLPLKALTYYGVLIAWLIVSNWYLFNLLGSNFRLVGITDIYGVRGDAAAILEASGSSLGGYVFHWLDGAVLPLLFAIALQRRNVWGVAAVIGTYVFLYGVWASKVSLVAPFYLLGLYWLMNRRPERIAVVFMLSCAAVVALPLLLFADNPFVDLFRTIWVTVINIRSFAVPGLLITQYLQFFSDHPLTYGSHVTGLNAFITYPYDYDIPRTVGFYYYGTLVTSNVNYWAQDGIAGFGLAGIPLVSLLAAGTFWIVDSLTRALQLRFVMVGLGLVLLMIANVSLFTTLVTGGLLLMLIAYLFAPTRFATDGRIGRR